MDSKFWQQFMGDETNFQQFPAGPRNIYSDPPPLNTRIQLWHRECWEFGEIYQLDIDAPIMVRLDSYLDAEPFDGLGLMWWLPAPEPAPKTKVLCGDCYDKADKRTVGPHVAGPFPMKCEVCGLEVKDFRTITSYKLAPPTPE